MKTQVWFVTVALGIVGWSCDAELPPPTEVAIAVAPLDLPSVSNAVFTIEVRNDATDLVWSKASLDSVGYGGGDGSVSYVGPCDASSNPNVVSLTLDELYANGALLTSGSEYKDPGTLSRSFDCVANQDVAVTFDLTILRPANQGFFDIAVTFDNIFCSAKLDCLGADDQPIELLHDAGGDRATTFVMGFACTTGKVGDITTLYRDDIAITCDAGTVTVNPDGDGNLPAGNITGASGILFAAQVTRGQEQFTFDKQYWNVALGFVDDNKNCVLSSEASAARGFFEFKTTPAGTAYPEILWDGIALTDSLGVQQCTHHPVDAAVVGVVTDYVKNGTKTFAHLWSTHPVPIQGQGVAGAPRYWADGTVAERCLDYFTPPAGYAYAGAIGDGVYRIDPDGAGGNAPFETACDMTNGGWTRVALDAFEDQGQTAAGWSWAVTPGTCGAFGSIMWMSNGWTEKRFTWPAIAHTSVRLDVEYVVIDSWDPWTGSFDAGYVNFGTDADFVPEPPDGSFVQIATPGSNALSDPDGTQSLLDTSWSQECGGAGDENAQDVSITLASHPDDYAWVRGSSTLGSSYSGDPTEEWGLDNVAIWVK